jgi:hypothetical protein
MTDELARYRARECRRIAEQQATTPIARENWYYLAEHWERAAGQEPEDKRKHPSRHWQAENQTFSHSDTEMH